MERINCWKKKILGSCRSHGGLSSSRLGYRMGGLTKGCLTLSLIGLIGCTTLKKASIVGIAGGTGALVGSLAGGPIVPVVGAVVLSAVADVITEAVPIGNSGKKLMSECAGDNFWTLLGQIVEMGGWFLLLLLLVPMVIGWVLPGPLERKKKS